MNRALYRLPFCMGAVVVTNEGASYGPRVATCSFHTHVLAGRLERLTETRLSADMDAALYQTDEALRRRAARLLVLFGKQSADMVLSGGLPPSVAYAGSREWARVSFARADEFEGFPRRFKAFADFYIDPDHERIPEPPEELVEAIGRVTRRLANDLHVAVSDVRNAEHFGGT